MESMVQQCIRACLDSAPLCDEFFLQLVRMTTPGHTKCSSKESLQLWRLFW
jgi:hypothetical protein